MRSKSAAASLLCPLVLTFCTVSSAQTNSARIKAIKARLQQLQATYQKMPPMVQKMMDGNANAAMLAPVLSRIQPQLLHPHPGASRAELAAAIEEATATSAGPVRVNNPSTDLNYSSFLGFTQSETHTGVCGQNVVVGFNDSGSYAQTLVNGTGGVSFSGVAVSHDHPVIGCSDSQTFYYSQLFSTADPNTGYPYTALAFSKSTDGGNTWSDPTASVTKDGFAHSLDKDWMAVDPSNPQRIYVSYTDFDSSFSNPACPNLFRTAAEVVMSNDGGMTWGQPIVVDTVCSQFGENGLQGTHVVVGSTGNAYVAYVTLNNFPTGPRQLQVVSLGNTGTPSAPVVVDAVIGGGDTFYLQGEFRDFLGLDFAIDKSGGPNDGALYITWDDGRDKSVPDLGGTSGMYAFDDVLARASFDGGQSWGSAPVRVNSDMQPRIGYGHDHYQPGIAVDSTGKIAICWYDRRNDPANFAFSRYCAESAGGNFANFKVNVAPNAPMHGIDLLVNPVYMGDYDGLASDFLKSPGFIGAFQVMSSQANPDVKAFNFQ